MCEQKIDIHLYGGKSIFGGRETPLTADITYCKAADACPLKKQGKCLMAARFSVHRCKFARIERVKGYTSRAKKYREFKERYESDPNYAALRVPEDHVLIMTIEGDVYIRLGSVGIDRGEDGRLRLVDPWLGDKVLWVPRQELSAEFFESACRFVPRSLISSSPIKDYQEKDVPMILHQLRDVLPDIYEELIRRHPELAERKLDHRGRYAKTLTLKDGSKVADSNGNVFVKKKGHMVCRHFKSSLVGPYGVRAKDAILVMPIPDDAYTEVESNDWVTDETEFK